MKIQLSSTTKEEIIKQYAETFNAQTLIAKDFVPAYVEVDMYRMQEDLFGSFSKYVTVGMTADEAFDSEFYVMTDGLLDAEKEKILLSDIADMISKLYSKEIAFKSGTMVKVSNEAKKAFGFDYYLFDFHNLGCQCYHVQPVQIYENEYNYVLENGHNAFWDIYEEQVPEESQFLFGAKREPLDI
ncbi:MAG: hypothetical protein E7539_07170 [Ruminococcaceae bacterium]|nr:hypothetical protein [Oscillospiraceae bacterium]